MQTTLHCVFLFIQLNLPRRTRPISNWRWYQESSTVSTSASTHLIFFCHRSDRFSFHLLFTFNRRLSPNIIAGTRGRIQKAWFGARGGAGCGHPTPPGEVSEGPGHSQKNILFSLKMPYFRRDWAKSDRINKELRSRSVMVRGAVNWTTKLDIYSKSNQLYFARNKAH